jgi:glycosyltransferase involved in cell wall biosynthesis
MNICYLTPDVVIPHYRGASTHVYEVAKNLVKLGHAVHVISRRISSNQPSFEIWEGIRVHRVYRGVFSSLPSTYQNSRNSGRTQSGLKAKIYEKYLFTIYAFIIGLVTAQIVKTHHLDIILERETSFGAGAIASKLTGRPLILELIGPRYSKYSLRQSKRVILYSKTMLQDPVPSEKLFFVTAATNTESFKPNPLMRKNIRKKFELCDHLVIGYVGTFPQWHGIKDLIQASVQILKQKSSIKFLMVGPYFEYAQNITKKLGVETAFIFSGPIAYQDVPNYINAADIMVAPYNPNRDEMRKRYGIGSPIKIFEYMACGKPVVTTDLKLITDIVQKGKTGLIVPPGDVNKLAESLIKLIDNPKEAREMGQQARRTVEHQYSWSVLTEKIVDVLEQCRR